jgi:hypothetical protein
VTLTVIVPTKGRPANAARLALAFCETCLEPGTRLVLALDPDEKRRDEYFELVPSYPWLTIVSVKAEPQRMAPVLNALAVSTARQDCVTHVGFMGDDHLPRTGGWDKALIDSLSGQPGVAFGNDLIQGEKLPTACIISADIIRSLGYMCPPDQVHLYLDDFWKALGCNTHLVYRNDVVVEHLHPTVGHAQWDDSYRQNNDPAQYNLDHAAYSRFLVTRWPSDLAKLRKDLSL